MKAPGKHIFLTLCLAGLATATHLRAQADAEKLSLNFSVLSWSQPIRNLYYLDGNDFLPIQVPNGAPGRAHRYQGSPTLGFYRQVIETDALGHEIITYQPIGSASLTPGMDNVLLLFIRNRASSQEYYQILPVPFSSDSFQANTFLFMNLTRRNVAIRVGEERILLSPGQRQVTGHALAEQSAPNVRIQIAADSDQDDWNLLYQGRWGMPGKRRAWVFIHGVEGGEPDIKIVYQMASQRSGRSPGGNDRASLDAGLREIRR